MIFYTLAVWNFFLCSWIQSIHCSLEKVGTQKLLSLKKVIDKIDQIKKRNTVDTADNNKDSKESDNH